MKGRSLALVLCLSVIFVFSTWVSNNVYAEENVTRRDMLDVAKEIHPPGCTDSMTADYCTLTTAYETRQEIWDLLQDGYNKEEIIDLLVKKYGERILASPVKQGFHLVAWIFPVVAIAIGTSIIFVFVRKWHRKKQETEQNLTHSPLSTEVQQKVHEELKNWL